MSKFNGLCVCENEDEGTVCNAKCRILGRCNYCYYNCWYGHVTRGMNKK